MRFGAMLLLVLGAAVPSWAGQAPAEPPAGEIGRGGSSRLIWGPTGRLLAPGHTTVTTYQLFAVPVVQTGLTSRMQLGIGAPFYYSLLVAPKFQVVSRGKLDVAAGAAHVWAPGGNGGYGYVASTYGRDDAAITMTAGVVYDSSGVTAPAVTIGGERRLSPRVVWITENYLSPGGVMTAGGFRITGPNKTVDLVLSWLITEDGVLPMPILNIGWRY
jgi:hypothetical protein